MQDRKSKTSYICTFKYMVDLADHCNTVINAAISGTLDRLNLFDPTQHIAGEEDVYATIDASIAMPDWAKAMARMALGKIDYSVLATELAVTRVKQMRSLLGLPEITS